MTSSHFNFKHAGILASLLAFMVPSFAQATDFSPFLVTGWYSKCQVLKAINGQVLAKTRASSSLAMPDNLYADVTENNVQVKVRWLSDKKTWEVHGTENNYVEEPRELHWGLMNSGEVKIGGELVVTCESSNI